MTRRNVFEIINLTVHRAVYAGVASNKLVHSIGYKIPTELEGYVYVNVDEGLRP